jgi:hypothetical protein
MPIKNPLKGLQYAAKSSVDENSQVISEKLAETLKVLIQKSANAADNKALKLQILKIQRDLRTDSKTTQLTAKILKEYNDVAIKVKRLQENAATSKVGQSLKDGGDAVANHKHMLELLDDIREKKKEQNKAFEKLTGDMRKSLVHFMGPLSPLLMTIGKLKEEYADEFKAVGKWLGVDKLRNMILLKRLDDGQSRERIMFNKMMTSTKKALGQLANKIGGKDGIISKLTDWVGDKALKPIFEALRKTGIGQLIEKAGKGIAGRASALGGRALSAGRSLASKGGSLLSKLLGAGKAGAGRAGGALGKAGGALGKALKFGGGKALGALGKVGSFGLKALGPLGAVVGLGDIALNSVDKGKTGEGALGDYAQGAMSGAELGMLAGPIGAAVGAALGIAATAIIRNWSTVKDAMMKGWTSIKGIVTGAWNGIVDFKNTVFSYIGGLWDSLKDKADSIVKWFSDHIPGFDSIKAAVKSAADQGTTIAGNAKAVVSGAAASAAGAALPYAQKAANAVSGAFGSDSAIGKAAQGISGMVGKAAMPSDAIKSDITDAAKIAGVDPGYLMATAAQESSFNPNAGAGTSSAKGLFQFTDGTWAEMVKKYGQQYGIGVGDRMDPKKNAIMGALYARDNANGLAKKGLATGPTELYAAHMLGGGGAAQLLSAMQQNPNADAAALLPKAAAANKNVFFNKDGSHKTVAEVYQFMQSKIGDQAGAYSKALGDQAGGATAAPQADKYTRVESQKPGADVTVNKPAPKDKGGGAPSGGAVAAGGSKNMPMAIGPTPFLVLQSDMIG